MIQLVKLKAVYVNDDAIPTANGLLSYETKICGSNLSQVVFDVERGSVEEKSLKALKDNKKSNVIKFHMLTECEDSYLKVFPKASVIDWHKVDLGGDYTRFNFITGPIENRY